jgi:Na+/glutamate symporter
MRMWTADDVGEAIVLLALAFLGAALIRKWSRHLRALFVPTAVIGGLARDTGLADQRVMPASLLLDERLPAPRKIWGISSSHVITAGIMSAGQFAVGWPRGVAGARARLRFQ